MTFYVTMRYIPIPSPWGYTNLSPKTYLRTAFEGLKFTSTQVAAAGDGTDGRYLYEINIDDSYDQPTALEVKETLLEGLKLFSVHEKSSIDSALELAEKLTKKKWIKKGGKIERQDK